MLSITDPSVQVVDTRASYPIAHIPGALPLSPYTLAATVDGVDFQIADPETAEAALSAIGVRRDSTVVVYGEPPEFDPARVVWALRYLGHEDVRYLNGGWAAWQADFRPVETGTPAFTPSDYEIDKVRDEIRVTGDWVLEQLGDPPYDAPAIQVVDARAPGEFEAGRIPTAVHVQWTRNLEGGLLRPRADLTALYADLDLDPKRTTVVYCLAGWRASVDWLVLTWLGFEDVRVYDGSWLEWGNGSFPVEVDQ
jgi:thiosulfate/3-mercaptopyruvate sulfurtransferase